MKQQMMQDYKFEGYIPTQEDYNRIEKLKENRNSLSEEFLKSEAVLSPIIYKAVYMINNGINIYTVFEEVAEAFYKKDKEQFEVIQKLIENYSHPLMFSAK